jgi:TetR/AcrR family transcriptional repressor of mexJK operon
MVTAELGRSERKRQAIMEAARTVFLRNGYAGASMDEVAAIASVSKQTVYKNFADKERLFTEIITGDIATAESRTGTLVQTLPDTEDFAGALHTFAREHITTVIQPHILRMRRLIIAEADRFPELARTWYAAGPERAHTVLAERFQRLAGRGLLRLGDPLIAAQHFNWLVLSIPLNEAMFHPERTFTVDELHHYADEGVRVFLAAYSAA